MVEVSGSEGFFVLCSLGKERECAGIVDDTYRYAGSLGKTLLFLLRTYTGAYGLFRQGISLPDTLYPHVFGGCDDPYLTEHGPEA